MSKLNLGELLGNAFHALADATGSIAYSSAIDADAKKSILGSVDKVKAAARDLTEAGEELVVSGAAAAPGIAGKLAAEGVSLASAAVPAVGPILSAVFGPVVSAAVSLAVSHFEQALVQHNGDHLAAAKTAIDKLAGAAPTEAAAKNVTAAKNAVKAPADQDLAQ